MHRKDGRAPHQLRPVTITRPFVRGTPGSCLIDMGHTRVIITATLEEARPRWLLTDGHGWVTAEYGMLPGSTGTRRARPRATDGRATEIQRLIGRSLRQAVDLGRLGERTVHIDCDVVQADGSTRAASITGGWVALHDALAHLVEEGRLREPPLLRSVQAVSVGLVGGSPCLDLSYEEDSRAATDLTLVTAGGGSRIVEVAGTAEREPMTRDQLDALLDLGLRGTQALHDAQQGCLHA
jgi:ribonuclease PH